MSHLKATQAAVTAGYVLPFASHPLPGLDPGIHVSPFQDQNTQDVDGRVKPGRGKLSGAVN
jgi:hypothetical protein